MTEAGGAATPFLPFAHGSTSPSWRPRTSSAAGWRRPAVPSRTGQIATISPEEATATSRKASCGHAAPQLSSPAGLDGLADEEPGTLLRPGLELRVPR